ncbi:MAG: methyl-accepting chemotaxis protein [Clostridiales Family XIII bacterium]|jgi:methyl-accepting chemotaxis protein|nr:methyl-accepting chemotaxis protein [Clostridiales Family XIII bacterium]
MLRDKKINVRLKVALTTVSIITLIVGLVGIGSLSFLDNENHILLTELHESSIHNTDITDILEASESAYHVAFILLIAITIVGFICSVLFSISLTKSIVIPLEKMTEVARGFSESGDLQAADALSLELQSSQETEDEVAILSRYYSKMLHAISEKVDVLETIAGGDLTVKVDSLGLEDSLANSINEMTESISKLLKQIAVSVDQIAQGTAQLSDGAIQLAQSNSQQSASVDSVMDSITEIASNAQDVAEGTKQTAKTFSTINNSANKGLAQINDLKAAVDDVNVVGRSISTMLKSIDDIAFQTNILSLNAAVEAARAGESGRGFAVVAEEVKTLATRSAQSSSNSATLIKENIDKTQLGSAIAADSVESFRKILSDISNSNRLIDEIAKSSEDQSKAIEAVNVAISQLRSAFQVNSQTAAHSASSVQQISAEASTLKEAINRLRYDNSNFESPSYSYEAGMQKTYPKESYPQESYPQETSSLEATTYKPEASAYEYEPSQNFDVPVTERYDFSKYITPVTESVVHEEPVGNETAVTDATDVTDEVTSEPSPALESSSRLPSNDSESSVQENSEPAIDYRTRFKEVLKEKDDTRFNKLPEIQPRRAQFDATDDSIKDYLKDDTSKYM